MTNLNDSGVGSLRAAVVASGVGDTINFAAGLTGTITLTTGELSIGVNLTITGSGAKSLTVSGNNAGVTVVSSGLTNSFRRD